MKAAVCKDKQKTTIVLTRDRNDPRAFTDLEHFKRYLIRSLQAEKLIATLAPEGKGNVLCYLTDGKRQRCIVSHDAYPHVFFNNGGETTLTIKPVQAKEPAPA